MQQPSYKGYLSLLWTRFHRRGLVTALLASLAFALAVAWALTGNGVFEPWANLATLGTAIWAVLASVWASMQNRVETGNDRDRYSLSYALAYGYVHNFLVGAVQAATQQQPPGKVFVFRPSTLDELSTESHEGFKAALAQRGFSLASHTLDAKSNRPRGILTVYRSGQSGGARHFVDFPTTLLTLSSLIDYQADQATEDGDDTWTPAYRNEMARTYVDHFFKELSIQAERANIRSSIDFTDSMLRNL